MKLKPLLVVASAMLMAGLTLGFGPPPCVGGQYLGPYTVRTCLGPTDGCDLVLFLLSHTKDQTCEIWCCPGSSTSVYNNCTPPVDNGCCRLRTDLGQDTPKIIYNPRQRRVLCTE